MSSARSWKRSVGLAVLVAVACGALQAATPSLERAAGTSPTAAREARLFAHKPKAVLAGAMGLRAVKRAGDGSRPSSTRGAEAGAQPDDDVSLEPWSLIAVALSVMIFIAGRRRTD